MTEIKKVLLPFRLEFGLEDLGGRAPTYGPYQVVEISPTEVVVAITITVGKEKEQREFREKLTPHDTHHQGRANWQAAAKQLGLKP